MNHVNNYLVAGPSTPSSISEYAFWGFTKDARIYQSGNRIDSDYDGRLNGVDTGWGMFHAAYTKESHRFPWPGIQQDDAPGVAEIRSFRAVNGPACSGPRLQR
jgi:hypothetical protein